MLPPLQVCSEQSVSWRHYTLVLAVRCGVDMCIVEYSFMYCETYIMILRYLVEEFHIVPGLK